MRRWPLVLVLVLVACAGLLAVGVHDPGGESRYPPAMAKRKSSLFSTAAQQQIADSVAQAQSAITGLGGEPAPEAPPASYDSGPGYAADYGGGYTISGPAAPTYDVYADPSYQMFLAALDEQQQTQQADVTARSGEVDRQLGELLPRIAQSGVEQRRRISGAAESRGVWRSGERLRDIGLQQTGEGQRVSDAQSGAARQKAELQSGLQAYIADLARQRAEKATELTASRAF